MRWHQRHWQVVFVCIDYYQRFMKWRYHHLTVWNGNMTWNKIHPFCGRYIQNLQKVGQKYEGWNWWSGSIHQFKTSSLNQHCINFPSCNGQLPTYQITTCDASQAQHPERWYGSARCPGWPGFWDSIVALFDTRDQNGTPKTWHLKKSRDWWTWNFRKLYMYNSSNWLASVGEGYSQTHTHLSEHLFIRELPIFHFDKCRSNFQTRIKGMLEGSQINHP